MSQFYNNSVFWIEVDKIVPNPYQPRREFDQKELESLADSIRQYGVLQALVVTRREIPKDDGGIDVEYELIAGERRLRASKIAGLREVPVLIKTGEEDNLMKLELAIIENVQREDLSPIDRAKAFKRLVDDFGLTHIQVGKKVGRSRAFVTNTIRLLEMPEVVLKAMSEGKISEGHVRALGMVNHKPDEQEVLLKEIILKKLNVREAEKMTRRIAQEKVRKNKYLDDPEVMKIASDISEKLGTRVNVEKFENGGILSIDFIDVSELRKLLSALDRKEIVEENKGEKGGEDDLYSITDFSL
ncbi:MAG: ParB/RepB/Spo0J family partition protein [Candidatus Pacebacteria bacterium]|nr:ParB/RepB/Spo0J family partition protein [Candidatus Paceibacterota bacterium]